MSNKTTASQYQNMQVTELWIKYQAKDKIISDAENKLNELNEVLYEKLEFYEDSIVSSKSTNIDDLLAKTWLLIHIIQRQHSPMTITPLIKSIQSDIKNNMVTIIK